MTNDADNSAYDLSQYTYDLPREMIAQTPAEPRDNSRLMVLHRTTGDIEHVRFRDIGRFLNPHDLLVLNDTKVFPARVFGSRHTGGKVELLFLRDLGQGKWDTMIRCNGQPREGEFVVIEGGFSVRLVSKGDAGHWTVSVPRGADFVDILAKVGHMPLPPYIKRERDDALAPMDRERYQTVYATETGAVAAPTAGLHFTEPLLDELASGGVGTTRITLHVGTGTFQPIKYTNIRRHVMHEEFYSISEASAAQIQQTRESGGRIVAVGTTGCRTLEAAASAPDGFGPGEAWTNLYIYPPYEFQMTDVLLTNFHLPGSTLLVLVAAFAGRDKIMEAYEEARRKGYRFYSYGDAMLIL